MRTFHCLLLIAALYCAELRAGPPPLLLANRYDANIPLQEYWVSEKLDGVRAYWNGQQLITRGGHLIHAPAWFTEGFPPTPLDGELWAGRKRFEQVAAAVKRRHPDEQAWHAIHYWVFDLPAHPAPFSQRLDALEQLVTATAHNHLRLVPQRRFKTEAALMAHLEQTVAGGGEGLMLHRGDSLYRAGRSDDLVKLKTFEDAEARVIAHLPGKGKFEGKLGALLVEDEQGRRFRLGSGLSNEERRTPPAIGTLVTYKYYGRTRNGLPRFASYLRNRDESGRQSAAAHGGG